MFHRFGRFLLGVIAGVMNVLVMENTEDLFLFV